MKLFPSNLHDILVRSKCRASWGCEYGSLKDNKLCTVWLNVVDKWRIDMRMDKGQVKMEEGAGQVEGQAIV